MPVWVNVWGKVLPRRILATALAACAVGCIDDFDNPKGYGPSSGSGTYGRNRESCAELCERSVCDGGSSSRECREQCDEISSMARRGGCSDELDDLLSCIAGLSNACTQQEACNPEVEDFSYCISRYCETDPAGCEI